LNDLAISADGTFWKDGPEHYYSAVPGITWLPRENDLIRLTLGIGLAYKRVFYLCPIPFPEGCGGYHFQRSWAGRASLAIAPFPQWPVRPLAQLHYTKTLGPLGSQPVGRQGNSLLGVGVGVVVGSL
jgi:hypothetical protein